RAVAVGRRRASPSTSPSDDTLGVRVPAVFVQARPTRAAGLFGEDPCARFSPGYDTITATIRVAAVHTGRARVGTCRSDGSEPSGRQVRRSKGDRQGRDRYGVPRQGYLYRGRSRAQDDRTRSIQGYIMKT